MKRKDWLWVLSLVAFAGCGGDEEPQTPFGSVRSVEGYREALEGIIVEANALEQEVRDRAVGSTGQATGQNLSPVYQELRPRLTALIAALEEVEPPRKLAEMHAEMQEALALRLEAFDLVIAGWAIEQERTFDEAQGLYVDAAKKLNEANALLLSVGEVLLAVDIALAEAEGRTLVS